MPQWQIASTVGSAGVHFSFYRKANDNVQVGVEFEAARKNLESITSLCYQMDIPKMNLLFRGRYLLNVLYPTLTSKLINIILRLSSLIKIRNFMNIKYTSLFKKSIYLKIKL